MAKVLTQEEVDAVLQEWHTRTMNSGWLRCGTSQDLPSALGWSWDEYAMWVYDGTLPKE